MESPVRLKSNRSTRLCFRSFALVPTLGVQRSWDGIQKAPLYNQQKEERTPLYIYVLLQKALLRSRKCTGRRISPPRKTGSQIETPPSACASSLARQKSLVYWMHFPNSTNAGSCSLSGIGMVESCPPNLRSFSEYATSIATTDFATEAVRRGARLITHLFNAMPQLHHRDPSIIGLLGASPHISPPSSPATSSPTSPTSPATPVPSVRVSSSQVSLRTTTKPQSEAFDDHETPPQTPMLVASRVAGRVPRLGLHLERGQVADLEFERPFYELIVDGIHSHPNSVRVCPSDAFY